MTIYKPLEFVLKDSILIKNNNQHLTHTELINFWNFINLIKNSFYSTIILRGESDENLRAQYGCDSTTPDILSQKIFMFGEKSRNCWNDKFNFDPDKLTTDNFTLILNRLKEDINNGCKGNSPRSEKMRKFVECNKEFIFSLDSSDNIIKKYEQLSDTDKSCINLYYLSLAHTINSYKYKKASNFVSVTTSSDIGAMFTDSITLYGWLPKDTYEGRSKINNRNTYHTIQYININYKEKVKKLKFPYCGSAVYPDQAEIMLRCGILPHFIIGFKCGRNFYVNPSIFETYNELEQINSFKDLDKWKREVVFHGLTVNQSNFEQFCSETNYKRYYTFDGFKYEMHLLL